MPSVLRPQQYVVLAWWVDVAVRCHRTERRASPRISSASCGGGVDCRTLSLVVTSQRERVYTVPNVVVVRSPGGWTVCAASRGPPAPSISSVRKVARRYRLVRRCRTSRGTALPISSLVDHLSRCCGRKGCHSETATAVARSHESVCGGGAFLCVHACLPACLLPAWVNGFSTCARTLAPSAVVSLSCRWDRVGGAQACRIFGSLREASGKTTGTGQANIKKEVRSTPDHRHGSVYVRACMHGCERVSTR